MDSRRERARSSRGLQGCFPFNSITQVVRAWLSPLRHSPRGHSQRFVVCRSVQLPSIFLHTLRSTIITRFFATTGALTSSWAVLRPPRGMNSVVPKPISLITVFGLPAIPSPTICGVSEGGGGFLQAAPRMPEGFALCDRLRTALAGSPISTDRIEFTLFIFIDERRYGLAVLVPLLSTPCFHDAVTVQYRTILHRAEADLHRFIQTPSQAHERGHSCPPPVRSHRGSGQECPRSGPLSEAKVETEAHLLGITWGKTLLKAYHNAVDAIEVVSKRARKWLPKNLASPALRD